MKYTVHNTPTQPTPADPNVVKAAADAAAATDVVAPPAVVEAVEAAPRRAKPRVTKAKRK